MKIEDVCNRLVVVGLPATSVHEGARLMREHHVGALVVIDSRDRSLPKGIVTDRDMVVGVLAMGVDPDKLTVSDIMSQDIVTVNPGDDVFETIRMMHGKGVRRVVVVDRAGALVGVVSLDDLLELVTEGLSGLSGAIAGARTREHELRR
jgi:signal-transduction protein with cAMP-binding, CBS, and nucleotidyltransferase domain